MSSKLIKYSLLFFPLSSFGLGVWQLKRLKWKEDLIANFERKRLNEPIELSSISSISDLDNLEYRRIKVRGRFDQEPNHHILLKPIFLEHNDEATLRGLSSASANVGVNVISPFEVEGTDLRILINRGWLALNGKHSVENSLEIGKGDKGETIEVIGALRKSDKRPSFGCKNDPRSNEWHVRDVEAMAKALNTAPIYLDADENLSRGRGPIGGQTRCNIRNQHLNYAITWFGLSAFSLLMWRGLLPGRGRRILQLKK